MTRDAQVAVVKDAAVKDSANDGTRLLLLWGAITLVAGIVFAILTKTVLGGIGAQGPNTNAGWLGLVLCMMCLPFGSILFLLGAAKRMRQMRHHI